MTVNARPLVPTDQPTLWRLLHLAIHAPIGAAPIPPEIVYTAPLCHYAKEWGRPGDIGFVALHSAKIVGAAWLRLLRGDERGFGFVDDRTPELAMAVLPEHRGQGIGSNLLAKLLTGASSSHYDAVCLSVDPDNPAQRLYRRFGFEVVREYAGSIIMVKGLGSHGSRS